ncbi:DUF1273 domain-containing protein [Lentilactobacillus kosonis]|uniref:UPF0398 protein NBRC111893_1143 n=1 Tax=Lentilactobacillus kosonis TaxID=2810561 RepID=A0A401FKY3_9LACO|nr:DUF1273 domain-containing protein [Lentilactobacillus kosonis]GAY72997.1 hypothetical protein NBRC111893_1143 [Lentilactobacillus kosonis]
MSRLWVTGYRGYELGVFDNKDQKKTIIDYVLKNELISEIESGVDWIITGGQMGIEQWTIQVANELKQEFPDEFQTAMILPFAEFGSNWNEANQATYNQTKLMADFTAEVSNQPYQSPKQLKNYQEFMISHTDSALLVYDLDNPGKTQYDYNRIKEFADKRPYPFRMISFDDLQNSADEYFESLNNGFQDE